MIDAADRRPDPAPALKGLKSFQRRTVDYAFRRLYLDEDSTQRFLVADEVGLGKTLVARGVIARAVEHLWDRVDRIDIIYVCSNADIARQNINRLRLSAGHDFARATRATLLPIQLQDMARRRVNYVSMTPGTSLEPSGGTGIAEERALLLAMLRDHWGLPEKPSTNVFRCGVSAKRFEERMRDWLPRQRIDPELHGMFLDDLDALAERERNKDTLDLKNRLMRLCDALPRRDSRLDAAEHEERRAVVGMLRAALGQTCIKALRPDLVILDEFQRFKHLLNPENEEAELARSLLEYADERNGRSEAVRVLLLSATPYKMYTVAHEDQSGDDHYADFVSTYEFLVRHDVTQVSALRGLLKEYRATIMKLGDGEFERLRQLKGDLETRLRRVIARTERLAVTQDRSGMLRECPSPELNLRKSEIRHYVAASRVASLMGHGDIVEYWKSAPYLFNFMDNYELKKRLRKQLAGGNGAVTEMLGNGTSCLLNWSDVQSYKQVDPANARLRSIMADTLDRGLWKLLWLPPSQPYYKLRGVFGEADALSITKRLIFSAWKVVPKVVAAILSHEAERRAMELAHREPDGSIGILNTADGRKKITALLRFGRANERLTGMPVLGLIYPSFAMARLLDPAALSFMNMRDRSAADLLGYARFRLQTQFDAIVKRWSSGSEVDEAWYWAAPILLDLAENRRASARFWNTARLSQNWSAEDDRDHADGAGEAESAWASHVDYARELFERASRDELPLGMPPPDLMEVLAEALFGSPAVVALRAIVRVTDPADLLDPNVRLAAGRVAWRFRNLFNLPEVISLIRGINREEPYWRRVVEYGVSGCLQAVLDEYVHVLHESLGVGSSSDVDAASEVADAITRAMGLRAAGVGVDEIGTTDARSQLHIEPRRMRSRFAARFGQDGSEADGEVNRAEQVRAAFNSPFWPFVLATTSVGQEGLDFHHYCHAVVHWNLPSNPVDLEQREGRVHRFKGHAIRKNIALRHGAPLAEHLQDPWKAAFERAAASQKDEANELVPFWVFPIEGGACVERYVPILPLSRDADRLIALRHTLAIYRMVFGQPRQDELVRYLRAHVPSDLVEQCIGELRVDLEPRKTVME